MADVTAVYRMNIGVSSTFMKKNSVFIETLIHILEYVRRDESFSHKKEIIASSIYHRQQDLMTCFNREKDYFKGFKLFLNILKKTNNKSSFIKLYFYSIYKSYHKNYIINSQTLN